MFGCMGTFSHSRWESWLPALPHSWCKALGSSGPIFLLCWFISGQQRLNTASMQYVVKFKESQWATQGRGDTIAVLQDCLAYRWRMCGFVYLRESGSQCENFETQPSESGVSLVEHHKELSQIMAPHAGSLQGPEVASGPWPLTQKGL